MYAKNFTNFSWLTSGSSNARGSTRRTWSQSTMRWDTFSTTYSTRTSPTSTGRNSTIPTVQEPHLPLQVVLPTYSTRTSPTSASSVVTVKDFFLRTAYCSGLVQTPASTREWRTSSHWQSALPPISRD